MTRVALVDDHAEMRAAIAVQLSAFGLEVVGEAADGDGAVSLVRATRPDVVLMDVRMPGRDGVSATAQIVRELPSARVLVLTTFDDDEVVAAALGAGAAGFLLKNAGPEALADAVARIAAGDAVLDAVVAPRVFAGFGRLARRTPSPGLQSLTAREQEVLGLLRDGCTNAEIGAALFVSEATAKTHVSNVLTKLGVRDRVQAVVHGYEHGFFDG